MNHRVSQSQQAHHTPGQQMPWPVSAPFRVAPGLQRPSGDPSALFLRDTLARAYSQAKQSRLRLASSVVGEPMPAVLQAIAARYESQTAMALPASAEALALGMQEDFVILKDHGAKRGFETTFLSVCFPSNWAPPDKLGKDFMAIHAPVADNSALMRARTGIESIAFRQQPMLRYVWLLSPNGDLAQDPWVRQQNWESVLAESDGDPDALLSRVYFRVERQSTLPLPVLQHAVFFIRVLVCPLSTVLAVAPVRATTLAHSLASMSDTFVAYRGMQALRDPLCRALERFAARTP